MNSFKWLHFSDLHISSDDFFDMSLARKKLLECLREEDFNCDYVFFTGDIVDKNNYESSNYIKEMLDVIKIDSKRVFWAVGNHDIKRHARIRENIIADIRKANNPSQAFESAMLDEEKRVLLTQSGMLSYVSEYERIFDKTLSHAEAFNAHIYYNLDRLNLVVLNTCLTSCDKEDHRKLMIAENRLFYLFEKITDKSKPTIVIGHHGKDFFHPSEQSRLADLFKSADVDMYLCGHEHNPGCGFFGDPFSFTRQFTCGGGKIGTHNVFTFILGEYRSDTCEITITPYIYADHGNKLFNKDVTWLNTDDGSKSTFKLEHIPIAMPVCSTPQSRSAPLEEDIYRSLCLDINESATKRRAAFMEGIRVGNVDSMYYYIGKESTDKYIVKMLHAETYTVYKDSLALLSFRCKDIIAKILAASSTRRKQLRIVSLGVGNGQKEISLLSALLSRTEEQLEHVAVDISPDMLDIGLKNIRMCFSDNANIETFAMVGNFMQIDKYFSEKIFPNKSEKINIFLLLGNTLGNFDEVELLNTIKRAMNKGDFILIDNQLKEEGMLTPEAESTLMEAYNSPEERASVHAVVKRANIHPYHGTIQQTVRPVNNAHLYGDDCVAVRLRFVFSDDTTIEVENQKLTFDRGDGIQVYLSKRYTKKALERIVSDVVGLKLEKDYSNSQYAMLLYKKR